MRIKQAYIALPHFREAFQGRYSLRPYSDPDELAIFFGCYNAGQLRRIRQHRSFALVVWLGSDAPRLASNPARAKILRERPETYHVAISNFIEADLTAANLPHRRIPLCTAKPVAKPLPLGDSVYVYLPSPDRLARQGEKYGWKLVKRLEKRFAGRIGFRYAWLGKCSQEALQGVYRDCFLGLRLTPHDGLSNTVIELGLMGRRCVTNLDTPNAIAWKDEEDVAEAIEREYQQREQAELFCTPLIIATLTKNYINTGNRWLYTEYWGHT